MEVKSDFQRTFLIFVNEDSGYESVQKPSGHIKIEVREGRGKLRASVQNLLESVRFGYRLYLMNTASGSTVPVSVGPLELIRSKGGIEWEFDPVNVGNTGCRIEDFGVAAILVEYKDRESTSVVCPLAAYRGKKTLWRNGLADRLYIKKAQQETLPEKNITSKYEGMTESKYIPPETEPNFNIQQVYMGDVNNGLLPEQAVPVEESTAEEEPADIPRNPGNSENPGSRGNLEDNGSSINPKNPENPGNPVTPETPERPGNPETPETPERHGDSETPETPETPEAPEAQVRHVDSGAPENPETSETSANTFAAPEAIWMPQPEQPMTQPEQPMTQDQYPNADTGLNINCLYLNSNMCGAYVNTGATNPCSACTLHNRPETIDSREEKGNIERLRIELDNNFERYDPFHVKRSDYSWWKVTNPVNLNNILYQCNIRSPLLFNPAVMVSHFKYRHFIIGIYTDRMRQREYVVCGVFGMHMVDRKPFGDMCKWVQTEGTRPKYGAFGYWIVYLDPATGNILSLK